MSLPPPRLPGPADSTVLKDGGWGPPSWEEVDTADPTVSASADPGFVVVPADFDDLPPLDPPTTPVAVIGDQSGGPPLLGQEADNIVRERPVRSRNGPGPWRLAGRRAMFTIALTTPLALIVAGLIFYSRGGRHSPKTDTSDMPETGIVGPVRLPQLRPGRFDPAGDPQDAAQQIVTTWAIGKGTDPLVRRVTPVGPSTFQIAVTLTPNGRDKPKCVLVVVDASARTVSDAAGGC